MLFSGIRHFKQLLLCHFGHTVILVVFHAIYQVLEEICRFQVDFVVQKSSGVDYAGNSVS